MAVRKGHKKAGGRKKGVPNKSTADARAAIALFVDNNAHRLQGWLDQIADGVQAKPVEGEKEGAWLVKPDPQKAYELFQSVIEYHVPKLARTVTDVNLKADTTVNLNVNFKGTNGG